MIEEERTQPQPPCQNCEALLKKNKALKRQLAHLQRSGFWAYETIYEDMQTQNKQDTQTLLNKEDERAYAALTHFLRENTKGDIKTLLEALTQIKPNNNPANTPPKSPLEDLEGNIINELQEQIKPNPQNLEALQILILQLSLVYAQMEKSVDAE